MYNVAESRRFVLFKTVIYLQKNWLLSTRSNFILMVVSMQCFAIYVYISVRQKFQVHEDKALAYKMQSDECMFKFGVFMNNSTAECLI